jgi:hypothetical protein
MTTVERAGKQLRTRREKHNREGVKLAKDTAAFVLKHHEAGESPSRIAEAAGVSRVTVHTIIKGF